MRALLCVAAAAAVVWLCLGVHVASGSTMSPLVRDGDRVLWSRITFLGRLPCRGEVVRVRVSGVSRLLRVAGIGGDTVHLRAGRLWVGDAPVDESYLGGQSGNDATVSRSRNSGPWRVPGGTVFLLSDRRDDEGDSRSFGCFPVADISGKALFVVYPAAHRGWL
ncbi:MAG: signal peptidase I [Proteobacteria bacterium]|nr:signal peptidase I [Pseudomonadota bacterium]